MKAYSKEDRQLMNDIAVKKYGNHYHCDLYGRFPWDMRGNQIGRTLSLSKAGLGKFVFEVLIRGGEITSFFVMNLSQGSSVFPRVWLTLNDYDSFFADTGYMLNAPPVAHVN